MRHRHLNASDLSIHRIMSNQLEKVEVISKKVSTFEYQEVVFGSAYRIRTGDLLLEREVS